MHASVSFSMGTLHVSRTKTQVLQEPRAVVGDFDSIRPEVLEYFVDVNCRIRKDSDQYKTDFGKALQHCYDLPAPRLSPQAWTATPGGDDPKFDYVVLGSLSGRVDQGIGTLHEMYREVKSKPWLRLWLISDRNVTFLLPPGTSKVVGLMSKDENGEKVFTRNAGIIPLFGEAVISLKGFEWDVTDWESSLGTQISSSNHVVQPEVEIKTDVWILFTIERNVEAQDRA
jgi:thiamine pyrophosphokinase